MPLLRNRLFCLALMNTALSNFVQRVHRESKRADYMPVILRSPVRDLGRIVIEHLGVPVDAKTAEGEGEADGAAAVPPADGRDTQRLVLLGGRGRDD